MTTAATHAFLPTYSDIPEAIDAQIESAIVAIEWNLERTLRDSGCLNLVVSGA